MIFTDVHGCTHRFVVGPIDFIEAHQLKAVVFNADSVIESHAHITLNFIAFDQSDTHHDHGDAKVGQMHAPK